MKTRKRVTLAKETLRRLTSEDLALIGGGTETASVSPTECCTISCFRHCGAPPPPPPDVKRRGNRRAR
ncbi:MAG TPA: hypothetical protein VMW75_26945 [Thermoanaerobaculia bacterium]|nr:hypothetical protein [Thermoanaerobaculia bacterium]